MRTLPLDNAARRYLSVCVSRRVMHFFVCAFYIYIYTLIYSLRTQKYIRRQLDLSFFQLIVIPFIFSNSQSDLYRLSFVAYSLIALIVFRFVQNIPSENVRSSFHRVSLLYNVEVVAEIVFVVTSTYAVIMTNCVLINTFYNKSSAIKTFFHLIERFDININKDLFKICT